MIRKLLSFFFVCAMLFTAQSCTSRAWYEGMKESQRQDCSKYASPTQRQDCLDRLNDKSYDQYEETRKKDMKKQPE